jgi:hypothetical protein
MREFVDRYKTGFQFQDWQKTGLLSSLAPQQEPQVVELFEKAMPYVLKNSEDKKAQFVLPVIRRVYVELVTGRYSNDDNKLLIYLLIDVDDLIKYFEIKYQEILPSFYGFKYIDPEAEFCAVLTSDYIGKINKKIKDEYSINNLLSMLRAKSRDRKIDQII